MATEKKINSRIQQKHDVAANWAKATNFIPQKGEIIIYDAEYNASGSETQAVRFKIGDGTRTVNNLPFAVIDYNNRIASLESTVNGLGTAAQKDVGFFATAAQGTKADNAVPNTRKVNHKALNADITLGASDVGVNETAFPGLNKTGTITEIKMNGNSKGTSGVVDLGTVITSHQDISGKANLAGNNTFTGGQTITGEDGGYSINASGYVKGSWLQSSVKSNKGSGTGMVCVFDSNGWIYYRTPSEILAEAGGAKVSDIPTFELSGDTLIINF